MSTKVSVTDVHDVGAVAAGAEPWATKVPSSREVPERGQNRRYVKKHCYLLQMMWTTPC